MPCRVERAKRQKPSGNIVPALIPIVNRIQSQLRLGGGEAEDTPAWLKILADRDLPRRERYFQERAKLTFRLSAPRQPGGIICASSDDNMRRELAHAEHDRNSF